ncbi:MAG: hypothetical protein E6F96_10250 [Actinobacteria bacterium]|nr:MAG: hypothetical protein E6F96_10250 [Actinomycetota bacterium]
MIECGTLSSLVGATVSWPTAASLATAGGTLVLALATFASVRSSNRSARIAELALQEQRRPVLVQSRPDDPVQKIMFIDGHWVRVSGSGGVAEHIDGNVYLVMSLRNVGAGIGVLQGWIARAGLLTSQEDHASEQEFRRQTRDLYIPPGDIGLWQGALRDPADDAHPAIVDAAERRQTISIELLYTDQVGGQRTISRFHLIPVGDDAWLTASGRHWYLDQVAPR